MHLNLSLIFDSENKFLLCGELVKFSLKISSPGFTEAESPEIQEFMKRIGANVEAVELDLSGLDGPELGLGQASSLRSSNSSSIDSLKGKRMKSVESLSNLLRSSEKKEASFASQSHSLSSDSQVSLSSMTSVTARRFSSLRASQAEATWNSEEEAIFIPLEIFIDPEGFPANCDKAMANIKISLNELVPILDNYPQRDPHNDPHNYSHYDDSIINSVQSSHKLERIGQAEISLLVLRPFEVSLRTHTISPTRALLQINSEFNCRDEPEVSLTIENVQIILSDSLASRANWNLFNISPISDSQVPFTFETSPQQVSLLFDWNYFLKENLTDSDSDFDFSGEDFHVRVEFQGKLKKKSFISEISLSFESSIPIFSIFPPVLTSGIQITSVKLLTPKPILFEAFQIELILHNFDEEMGSIDLIIGNTIGTMERERDATNNSVQEWFKLEEQKKCPSLLLLSPCPLGGINIENIPSNGSKTLRLKFVPIRPGVINLNEEIFLKNGKEAAKIMRIDPIIFRIE